MFYFRLYTDSGYAYRYATYSGFAYPGWHEFTVDLAMMSTDAWVYNAGQYGSCPNLSSVTAFQFLIQQQTGIASGGVSTTYIDNWRGFTKSNLSIGTTLMDFNYASVDTLTADWKANPSTAGTTSIALSTTSFFGDKSLDLYSNLTYYWTNIGYTHSIPTTDMSGIKYFKVWMYGDPAANTTANPLFLFTLQDANLSQAWAKVAMVALSHPEWQAVYMPLYVGDTAGGYNTFIQNTWDPGRATTSIDLSKIIAIQLLEQTGSNGYPAVYHTYFDEIDFGWATAIPFIMTPNTLSVRPSSSAVPVTVYSGVGPYTWAIDPGLGTLSATTGTSVNFTPGSFVTSGNIYIYDATGETATVPVAIAATAAPMAPESFYHPSLSSKMGKDWSLFE
jgi:hypothetical protein